MMFCKEWKRVAQEDFLWKTFCAIEWQSTCQSPTPPTESYGPETYKTLFPPKISLEDLKFFIDVWVEDELLFSKVVKGPMLRKGSWVPPPGHLEPKKIVRVVDKAKFEYFEEAMHRAMAYDYPIFASKYPFVPKVRAWVSMLYSEHVHHETMKVYSLMLDFRDAATSEEEVLWLLDMLHWK